MDESYRLRRDEVPSVFLWQELPFVLFDKHFDAGLQFLDIILFEKPEIAFNAIIVVDPLLLHHAVVTFIASNQDRHRTSSSVLPPISPSLRTRQVCYNKAIFNGWSRARIALDRPLKAGETHATVRIPLPTL